MAHLLRPLFQWPRWRHRCSTFSQILSFHSSPPRATTTLSFLAFFSTTCRQVHFRARAPKLRDSPPLSDANESDDESSDGSSDVKKSRNEKKREARRAVRWGMDLANFSPFQIKRILRVADLEQEVFEAIMVVKRLGRDVREGKRRQYNYIGRLLRGVEPELMDGLIQAIKDGDQSKFQDLSGTELPIDNDEEAEREVSEEEEEEDFTNMAAVTRWFDGLINKDIDITNEIYSLREVDFDRQKDLTENKGTLRMCCTYYF
ncbi:uncharacterized protein LOC131011100 isoform X2 [Salvia miltiorrhiza]|uniref:uncharacterized protein LOC131011100 isoform X2 n=1 Tax=Salvia miltiorrhiza TaxID=226208 RepID=UPI0025AC93E4|nr:uncharacterized protein LOC131011100 isoform X2 [Salvia miltiorrhiza]